MIGLESGCVFCNPIAPLVTSGNFCPLKYGVFHGIPVKDSGGATIEDTQVVVGCKKIKIYVRASAEKNTFRAYLMPILMVK